MTEIYFWGTPTYWWCKLWETRHRWEASGGQREPLITHFCRLTHPTWYETHRTQCMLKETNTYRVSKTVKAMYLGHFLNTIPKYQGSPSVSYKSSWDACWKLYINSLHVSVPMIPTPLETAYFPLLSKWRPPSKWVTPDSQEINYSKNSIQGPGSVKTLKSHDTVGDSTTWPWTYEHWMRSTTCKVLIRMKARERRLKWWTNPFPFPPWAI